MTGIHVSIIFTCTHCTHSTLYPQLIERKKYGCSLFFGLHTLHTLPTESCKKKYGCYLLFSPALTAQTAHSTHISPNHPHHKWRQTLHSEKENKSLTVLQD